jgi:retron-type reverse transcriptase
MSNVNNQPIPTLYVNNLESKVKKEGEYSKPFDKMTSAELHSSFAELKRQLYALFVPYGKMFVHDWYRSHQRNR